MGQHGAHVREFERPLAVGELDLALRQVRAHLHGQARKPGRGRVEDPSHQLVPSIKERIVNRFPIFLGGTDRTVELHQLALELEEGSIIAGRIVFRHLAHASGDATNAVLAAAGYNFRRLLAWLRFLLLRILIALGLAAQLKLAQ